MAEFKTAFKKMHNHEGGYVNDPDDQGGETYKGISRTMHKIWSGWAIIDRYKNKSGFPATLDQDVELQKEIEQFYRTNFWSPLNAEHISNQTIADSIFDFSVNAGVITSIRLAQSIVGVKADGIIGEQTLRKLNSLDFGYFLPAFTVAKISHYITIIIKRPANKKYFYGWVIRALEYNE
jgi:lysozyme family protein